MGLNKRLDMGTAYLLWVSGSMRYMYPVGEEKEDVMRKKESG